MSQGLLIRTPFAVDNYTKRFFNKAVILRMLGRSLSALASSQILMNPESEEAYAIRGWFDSEGSSMDFSEYSRGDGGSSGGGEIYFPVKLILVYSLEDVIKRTPLGIFTINSSI